MSENIDEARSPLEGVTVLEVGNYIAGPYCGTILADLGANVVKIEHPEGGDVVRSFGPELDVGSSAFYTLNRNKKSIAIDLRHPDGEQLIRALVNEADVLIENLRPKAMDRLGLSYDRLSTINPQLIYLSASGWGQDGPLASHAGLDIMAQARSGLMSITGEPGGDPVKAGVPICDIGCAMYGAIAILAALNNRHETGQGEFIDVSLFETGVSYALWEFAKVIGSDAIPGPRGSVHQSAAPYQAVRAERGWFTIGAATPKTWDAFAHCLGLDWMLTDKRYATNAARMENRESLIAEIEKITTGAPVDHWIGLLEDAGVPVAPIQNYREVFSDEALLDRDFLWEGHHASGQAVPQMGSPMRFTRTSTVRRNAAPDLGEHTAQILTAMGMAPEEVESLRESQVIR